MPGAKILVSITGFDMEHGANARLGIGIRDQDDDGFNLVFNTWADTTLYAVWADWIAFTN